MARIVLATISDSVNFVGVKSLTKPPTSFLVMFVVVEDEDEDEDDDKDEDKEEELMKEKEETLGER